MNYPGFIGPSNVLAALSADVEETINWYLESSAPGTGKTPGYLRPTPGLDPWVVLGTGPVTTLFYQDGRGFAVGGDAYYEIFGSQTSTSRGTVAVAGFVPSISSNGTAGNQNFVTAGGFGYINNLTSNAFAIIGDGDFLLPSAKGAFFDGYFVNLKANSRQFQISALEDGTAWDALDVFEISTASDNIVTMVVAHRELWLFGSKTTQVWADIGDPDTPIQPIPGSLMQQGIWAPSSLVVCDNRVFWLGQSDRGINVVYTADGYAPQRISTHAIETYMNRQERTEDAIAWTYQQEGHTFYLLYAPSWDTTLCFDVTTGQWHKRDLWDSTLMRSFPHLGRCATLGFGKILVGDRQSPAIYSLDASVFTDGVVTVT